VDTLSISDTQSQLYILYLKYSSGIED